MANFIFFNTLDGSGCDMRQFDISFAASALPGQFEQDVSFGQDVLTLRPEPDPVGSQVVIEGLDLEADAGAPGGYTGTVRELLLQIDPDNTQPGEQNWEIRFASVDIGDVIAAIETPGLDDDVAVLNLMLAGNDFIMAGNAADRLIGGDGRDSLFGFGGDDTLLGGSGLDTLEGSSGGDLLVGGGGADTASYRTPSNAVGVSAALDGSFAGKGDGAGDRFRSIENLSGSDFDDKLAGDAGNNSLDGRAGHDLLFGRAGDDQLTGRQSDIMNGGLGSDSLLCGTSKATLQYRNAGEGDDLAIGFGSGDKLSFKSPGFADIAVGKLAAAMFLSLPDSNEAADANDHFIFRESDSSLWFDRDGTGAAAPVMMIVFNGAVALDHSDILIEA